MNAKILGMDARRMAGGLILGLGAAASWPAAAVTSSVASKTYTVVDGSLAVSGGEEACFRLADTSMASDRILVRVRFIGRVPHGRVQLDGAKSDQFQEQSEEFSFVVSPGGTHRVALDLSEPGKIDWLSVSSTETTVIQGSCDAYLEEQRHRVDLSGEASQPATNRFESKEETQRRQQQDDADRLRREQDDRDAADRARRERDRRSDSEASDSRVGGAVPAGTELQVTTQNSLDTRTGYDGQAFRATLDQAVVVSGRTLIPAGSDIEGHVIEAKDAKRFGHSTLRLGFDKATLPDGRVVTLQASLKRVGKGSAAKQGGIIAGSAVGGALLASVLGKDAAVGAILGGGIAAGSIAAKKGESIVLPAGTTMTINLDNAAEVPWPETRRDRR